MWAPALPRLSAVIKLRHGVEQRSFRLSLESGGFCQLPVTEEGIAAAPQGSGEGGRPPSLRPGGRGLMAGIEEMPAPRKKMVAGGIWMLARSLFSFFFSLLLGYCSYLFDTIVLFAKTTPPPFFSFPSFWRGLMESRFNYNNFWLCEPFGRLVLRWSGSVMDHHNFLLLNQTYVLSNVRPELLLFIVVFVSVSVLFLFFTTDIHTFIYFTLIFGRIFHLGGKKLWENCMWKSVSWIALHREMSKLE